MDIGSLPGPHWLTKQLDKWFVTCNGYNRLRSARFPQACKSFTHKYSNDSDEMHLMQNQNNISVIKLSCHDKNECKINKVSGNNLTVHSAKVVGCKNRENSFSFRSLRGRNKKNKVVNNQPILPAMSENIKEIPDLEYFLPMGEEDLLDLERQNREFIFELHRKRILLDETREELNEAVLKIQDLERQLINEKRKNENDNLQNKLMLNATVTLEDERKNLTLELYKLKSLIEITTAERNCLKDQTRNLYTENIKLKREIEDLESKHRCHEYFQKDLQEHQARLKAMVKQFHASMNSLRSKQEDLKKLEESVKVLSQLDIVAKQLKDEKSEAVKRQRALEEQLVLKTAELSKMQDLLEESPLTKRPKADFVTYEYWASTVRSLEKRLALELDGSATLTQTLMLANQTQISLIEREKGLLTKIEELEKRLAEVEARNDTTDLGDQSDDSIIGHIDWAEEELNDNEPDTQSSNYGKQIEHFVAKELVEGPLEDLED